MTILRIRISYPMRFLILILKSGLITIIRQGQREIPTVRVCSMRGFHILIMTERNISAASVENVDGKGDKDILYANVSDWNFKKLGTGTILYPQIFDDVAFFTLNNKVYACDLIKNPDGDVSPVFVC